MLIRTIVLVLCGVLGIAHGLHAQSARPSLAGHDVPFEKFVLPNGLTVIVHEDHKAPIVAVNIWYHVGSKNERPGRTGFAHLFEHLMFQSSEHNPGEYINTLERFGVTEFNGTTWLDRTNYFQNVPVNALDAALWLESDRMGHLLGAITKERLDEQRGVVQNEKREGENEPYGRVWDYMLPSIFPAGHPYSWETIGSMDDLNAASLADVKTWFQTYYGAANAVLVLAGDITPAVAKAKAELYFGDIPSGPPVTKQAVWIAKRTGTQRQIMQDRAPQARIYQVWNVPQWGAQESAFLDLAADILATGKTSRLYKRLVYDDQLATGVVVSNQAFELAGIFEIRATARPGVDLARVEAALDEEVARFLKDGPTAEELERVKTGRAAGFIRSVEAIGGFAGKSDLLATSAVYGGDPASYKRTLSWIENASAADVTKTARAWLSDGKYALEVRPFREYTVAAKGADRSKMPAAGPPPVASFPKLERTTLANGLEVILARRQHVPLLELDLVVDAGYSADQHASPGTAALALAMLDEGTKTRNSLQISEQLDRLGARLGASSDLDMSHVTLSTLKQTLPAALDVYADVILNPAFPASDFERLRKQQLAAIQREQSTPLQMALRVFPRLLYGAGHAYGQPLTGSGTTASVGALRRDDLITFHTAWFKPNNAKLIAVGDITLDELRAALETRFGTWQKGSVPLKNIGTVAHATKPAVYLIDRPGSPQTVIFAGHVAPPKGNPNEVAIETMNNVLGAQFTARINMNLREDKHWSYGAYSLLWDARGQRPFLAYAPVQTDKTRESIQELVKEFEGILGKKPIADEELSMAQGQQTLTLPGQWETNAAVLASVSNMVRFNLPDNYYATYADNVRKQSTATLASAAKEVVRPGNMLWVIVGDRAAIEAGVRELKLGDLTIIDTEGNEVKGPVGK